ncbi:MAG: hypothetical protein P1P90_03620 [Patescibacteria group bacterium]|nr:hypothetical protein [Patescibacteria group bacterium]
MNSHRTLDSIPFSEIKLGQVTYVKESDTLFVVCGLNPEFPGKYTPRESEIHLLSETGNISHIFHEWGDNQILIDHIIPENLWSQYQKQLKNIRKSL